VPDLPDYIGVRAVRDLGLDPATLPTYWLGLDGEPCGPAEEIPAHLDQVEGAS
jgi:hypothetical protein